MKTILKLFLMIFFLICFPLFAEADLNLNKYRMYVTAVDEDAHCFAVSNGLIFHLIKKHWTVKKLPEIGVEIKLIPMGWFPEVKSSNIEEGEFIVLFDNETAKNQRVLAWLSPDSEFQYISYVSTQNVCVEPAGWFSMGEFENIIELSDGSKWIQGPLDPLLNKEDRIIISPEPGSENWLLINLNRLIYFDAHIARIKTFSMYRFAQIKSYKDLTGG